MTLPESGLSQLSELLLAGEHVAEQELEHGEEAGQVYVCEA